MVGARGLVEPFCWRERNVSPQAKSAAAAVALRRKPWASCCHCEGKTGAGDMVGARGFEPPTPWSRTRCSTRLSHAPTEKRSRFFGGTATDARRAPRPQNHRRLEDTIPGAELASNPTSTVRMMNARAGPRIEVAAKSNAVEITWKQLHYNEGKIAAAPPDRLPALGRNPPWQSIAVNFENWTSIAGWCRDLRGRAC